MNFLTVSFSGAGHLLPYHLGVAQTLLRQRHPFPSALPIRAVAGSSSGAIAATCFALLSPQLLDEYTDRFLRDKGRAYVNLKEILQQHQQHVGAQKERNGHENPRPMLSIATTGCSDGALHLHTFFEDKKKHGVGGKNTSGTSLPPPLLPQQIDDILLAVTASCTIPRSFHPVDVFGQNKKSDDLWYPNEDGVMIDGVAYVDGGIVAPAPPTPLDTNPNCVGHIVVSPISGCHSDMNDHESTKRTNKLSIRPHDTTFALPFSLTARCGTFDVRPSIQNLRSMVVAVGLAKPSVLKDWHRQGMDDAERFLDALDLSQFGRMKREQGATHSP